MPIRVDEIHVSDDTLQGLTINSPGRAFGAVISPKAQIAESRVLVRASLPDGALKSELVELSDRLAVMLAALPDDAASNVVTDLSLLTSEATKQTPRRDWYVLSAAGLMDAAKTVGPAGDPVIESVKKVRSLLDG